MKKKILSLILVAAMLASMLVFAPVSGATADTKATVEVTDSAGFAGGTAVVNVVVTINALDGENPIQSFTGLVEYDRSRLELVSAIRTDAFNQDPGTDAADSNANPMFAPYVKDGWTSLCGFNGNDATEGLVAFTMTFNIKGDAPAGDAYVKFHHVDGGASEITYDSVVEHILNKASDITYIDGKVTVLEGVAPVIDPANFGYVDNEDGTCTITEYFGDASVLTIPSEIDGLTVVGIGSMIFCEVDHDTLKISKDSEILENNTVTTIIIPATVKEIGAWAFMNANACYDVVILGDSLDYVSGTAFGCVGGSWKSATSGATSNRGKFNEDAWMLGDTVDEDGYQHVENVRLTIVNADSLGADFAAESGLEGNCVKFNTVLLGAIENAQISVTLGDETTTYSAFGKAITAPTFDGVVAWTDAEGNVYAPGADLGDATEITAVIVDAPVSDTAVTAKITDEFAMRFQATVSKATYDAMAELGAVQMGMLITPRQYVVMAGNAFTKEALDALVADKIAEGKLTADAKGYVDVPVQNPISANAATFEDCTEFTIAGSLAGLKESTAQKNPDFVAIGYLQVALESGDVVTVYGEYNYLAANNVGDFLSGLKTDGLGDTELGWINEWKDLFN